MDFEHQSQLMKLLEEEFICPIYKMPIHNPVITPVGITYEKEALEEWLDINGVEPQSKNPLNKQNLVQNLALKELIGKIYKEVPKLERSLTEKDDMIANLTEEVAQLKKELEYEKQKSRENEELTDFTLEKTKKIRKIQEEAIGQKEMERMKLKQKLKEIWRLRSALNQEKSKQKLKNSQQQSYKNEISRLNNQLTESRKQLQLTTEKLRKMIDQGRLSIRAWKQIQRQAYTNSKSEFWHRQHMIESLFDNRQRIAEQCAKSNCSIASLKMIVDSGVDEILKVREQSLIGPDDHERSANATRELFKKLRNRILIQRYLLDLQIKEDLGDPLIFSHRLTKIGTTVGYEIDFLPFSQPPTEQEQGIDWSKVRKVYLSQYFIQRMNHSSVLSFKQES